MLTTEVEGAVAAYSARLAMEADTDFPQATAAAIAQELRKFFESPEGLLITAARSVS